MAKSTRKTRSAAGRQSLARKNKLRTKLPSLGLIAFLVTCLATGLITTRYQSKTLSKNQNIPPIWPEEKQKKVLFWEKIVAQYPDYPDAYLQLAWLAMEKNDPQKAIRYRQLAAQLAPNHPGLEKINLKISP